MICREYMRADRRRWASQEYERLRRRAAGAGSLGDAVVQTEIGFGDGLRSVGGFRNGPQGVGRRDALLLKARSNSSRGAVDANKRSGDHLDQGHRVGRGLLESILDAAKAKGLRSGDNPSTWRGNLAFSLPKRQKLQRGHHAAMPFEDVPAFVAKVRAKSGISLRAMEFTILTAARTGEVRGATWQEIDLEKRVWTIPADRMKAGREHRVPLTDRCVAI